MLYNDKSHKIRDTFNKNIDDRNKINSKAKSIIELKHYNNHNVRHFETDWITLTNTDYPQSKEDVGFRVYSASGISNIALNTTNVDLQNNFKIDIIPVIRCNKPNKELKTGYRTNYGYSWSRYWYDAGYTLPLFVPFYFEDVVVKKEVSIRTINISIYPSSFTFAYNVSVFNEGNDSLYDTLYLGTDWYYYIHSIYNYPPGEVTETPPSTWGLGRQCTVDRYLPELLTVQVKFLYNLYAI